MAEPRVFISSTFKDLKYIRPEVEEFINSLGYKAVRFETGDIPFSSDKPLDDMCYDEVSVSDLYVLIIGQNYGTVKKPNIEDSNKQISITRAEYRCALRNKLKIYVFVDKEMHYRYKEYKNKKLFVNIDDNDKNIISFIDEIYLNGHLFIHDYEEVSDIKNLLKKQWAGMLRKYVNNERKYEIRKQAARKINAYKLFFFRRNQGLSLYTLASRSGISLKILKNLEKVNRSSIKTISDVNVFSSCSYDEAQRIADSLNCGIHNILAGSPDDFLTQVMLYYKKYKGKSITKKIKDQSNFLPFKTKAVIFDFDGTLTISENDYTTWEEIWIRLGYNVNECADYHNQYNNGIITHGKWCSITEEKFKNRKLNKSILNEISNKIKLIDGIEDLLKKLDDNGIELYMVSGSIDYIIDKVIGPIKNYFIDIRANSMRFNEDGYLKSIIGTEYDFEGKSDYIKQLMKKKGFMPYEVLFIGNSINDTFVHESGAITVCVNPKMTDPDSRIEWNHAIRFSRNINDIMKYINI